MQGTVSPFVVAGEILLALQLEQVTTEGSDHRTVEWLLAQTGEAPVAFGLVDDFLVYFNFHCRCHLLLLLVLNKDREEMCRDNPANEKDYH